MLTLLLWVLGVYAFGFLVSLGFQWNSGKSLGEKLSWSAKWPGIVIMILLVVLFYKGN